jgi:tRNA threonylcarbamoyladenosine biosynthesis protein TsaB
VALRTTASAGFGERSLVLAIDTAGPVVGVAVWDGRRAFERTARLQRGTEEHLPRMIEEVCRSASIGVRDLVGVGVAGGPGAFTGLRVGVATAAGLATALKVPLWTTGSLEPRAALAGFGRDLLVMLDARKGRVYAAAWRSEVQVHPPADVEPDVALSWVHRPFRAMGEGALAYREAVEAAGGGIPSNADQPGIGLLARMTAEALQRGEGTDPLQVRTEYLREPDAVARPVPEGQG